MINGDLNAFLDSLALGMELEVAFRGKRYLIQGWDWSPNDPTVGPHIEMVDLGIGAGDPRVFSLDAKSRSECTRGFLEAPLWDGLTFNEAEPEIEWVA